MLANEDLDVSEYFAWLDRVGETATVGCSSAFEQEVQLVWNSTLQVASSLQQPSSYQSHLRKWINFLLPAQMTSSSNVDIKILRSKFRSPRCISYL